MAVNANNVVPISARLEAGKFGARSKKIAEDILAFLKSKDSLSLDAGTKTIVASRCQQYLGGKKDERAPVDADSGPDDGDSGKFRGRKRKPKEYSEGSESPVETSGPVPPPQGFDGLPAFGCSETSLYNPEQS